jgi:hypothetical protein
MISMAVTIFYNYHMHFGISSWEVSGSIWGSKLDDGQKLSFNVGISNSTPLCLMD